MTTNRLKPDKPKRQPKEGSKESALRDMREEAAKAAPDFLRVKNRLTAEHENLAAEKKRKIAKLRETKELPPLPAASAEPVTAAAVEPKESEVRKTKHTTKSKSRNAVNGKTASRQSGSGQAVADFMARKNGASMDELVKEFKIDAHPMRSKVYYARHTLGYKVERKDGRYFATAPK